ncbi:MAG: hypothetical protein NT121_07220 [Chloroflexi bacterium]|nr:hypothetical protein [Chloroflexota bacterium]
MHTAKGCITEIYLDGRRAARLSCPPALIPAPGKYLLAHDATDFNSPLPHPIYSAGTAPGGFYLTPPIPPNWQPGTELTLRGPLGHGFSLPESARFVALAAFGSTSARLLALLEPALAQKAAIVLLTDYPPAGLPSAVEISRLSALPETAHWADYFAIDLPHFSMETVLKSNAQHLNSVNAQVFIETPVPCGGMADCGVCAVRSRKGYQLACKDGPVFDVKQLIA